MLLGDRWKRSYILNSTFLRLEEFHTPYLIFFTLVKKKLQFYIYMSRFSIIKNRSTLITAEIVERSAIWRYAQCKENPWNSWWILFDWKTRSWTKQVGSAASLGGKNEMQTTFKNKDCCDRTIPFVTELLRLPTRVTVVTRVRTRFRDEFYTVRNTYTRAERRLIAADLNAR